MKKKITQRMDLICLSSKCKIAFQHIVIIGEPCALPQEAERGGAAADGERVSRAAFVRRIRDALPLHSSFG